MKRFTPEPGLTPPYASGYDIRVSEEELDSGHLRLVVSDRDLDTAMAVFTTERAREIAKALTEMAERIESRPPRVGDKNLTEEQFESLPVGTVVRLSNGRTAFKQDAAYRCWTTSNCYELSSLNLWVGHRDAKIEYLPEVNA